MMRFTTAVRAILAAAAMLGLQTRSASGQDSTDRGMATERSDAPFTREVWLHAMLLEPTLGEQAFGVTLDGVYHFASRAHDRWRRNSLAEVLARPHAWVKVEVGYDPASALTTGGGVHFSAEGSAKISEDHGAGAYARYDRAVSDADVAVHDFEVGGHVSIWSTERRTYVNEKVGYRRISRDGLIAGVDEGGFLQVRHHLVYVPSEDWTLTFVQDGAGRIGIGSDPHTNAMRVENLFLLSPTLLYSLGPMIGINLEYFVGPATSSLSIPVGARFEVHPGRIVISAAASYDVATQNGQRTAGLAVRGSAGIRF